jgi:hypothetical protein
MSLPEITLLDDNSDSSTSTATTTVHKIFDWDFEAGDFKLKDGKLVEVTGIDYVKLWIKKALLSSKGSLIYVNTNYGSEHMTLFGSNLKAAFLQSEYERLITEALIQNDAISQIDNFGFAQIGSRLEVSFDVQSIYGTTREAVTV